MEKKHRFEVDESSIRLDLFLSNKLPSFSRTSIQNSIKSSLVKVNGLISKASMKLSSGDIVEYEIKKKDIQYNYNTSKHTLRHFIWR